MKTIVKDKAIMMEEIRELIAEGRTVSLTVKGNSMNPFLVSMRDQMKLGPWKDQDIRNNYLIHRIIERNGDTVTLLGDGNVGFTETATLDNIIGIMYSVTRKGHEWKSDSALWRFYSWLWMMITPVRRWPPGLWRRLFL